MNNVQNTIESGIACSQYFKVGCEHKANSEFVSFIDQLDNTLTQLQINTDKHIIKLLNLMSDALANKDYLFLADIIEFELVPILTSYTKSAAH